MERLFGTLGCRACCRHLPLHLWPWSRWSFVEVVAVAGGDLQVVAADWVDQPVLIVDAARRPAGQRAFQHLWLADTCSLRVCTR